MKLLPLVKHFTRASGNNFYFGVSEIANNSFKGYLLFFSKGRKRNEDKRRENRGRKKQSRKQIKVYRLNQKESKELRSVYTLS